MQKGTQDANVCTCTIVSSEYSYTINIHRKLPHNKAIQLTGRIQTTRLEKCCSDIARPEKRRLRFSTYQNGRAPGRADGIQKHTEGFPNRACFYAFMSFAVALDLTLFLTSLQGARVLLFSVHSY